MLVRKELHQVLEEAVVIVTFVIGDGYVMAPINHAGLVGHTDAASVADDPKSAVSHIWQFVQIML